MRRAQVRWLAVIVVALGALGYAATSVASSSDRGDSLRAPGGPGGQSYLDLARKDCFATAANTTSKVWFTVADGVLSDTFSPSIQNSNVNTLQYIVTDGKTFTDMQQRDMSYTVTSPDRSGMVCRVTSRDPRHGFALQTDYVTDPARDSVVMHTTLEPINGASPTSLQRLKVYVRFDAQIDNTGGGGKSNALPNDASVDSATGALVASDTTTPTGPWAAQVVGALLANRRFTRESSGFVDTPSDGLNQLDTYHHLRFAYTTATDGNVVQTAELNDPTRSFTLALGFGPSAATAIDTARQSAATPYASTLDSYENGWHRYDTTLRRPMVA
jgi:glucoamylase